jgi:NAD+ diphosphatase
MAILKTPLAFTGNPLDRASEKRGDVHWLAEKRAEKSCRILPFWRTQPLLFGDQEGQGPFELGFLDAQTLCDLGVPDGEEVLLGLHGSAARFARDVSTLEDPSLVGPLGAFREARPAAALLAGPEIAILAQGKALLEWHARTGFCSVCGGRTVSNEGGYRRTCTACPAEHFPRTDPVAIMLVTDGDACLLARNRRYVSTSIHSTLAGFIEPGESIEEAVRREVFEEVGVRTGTVRYAAAQPWPFPFSLMIGCYAEAVSKEILVDGTEIVAARWFSRREVRDILNGLHGDVSLPRPEAIAYHLVREWAEE